MPGQPRLRPQSYRLFKPLPGFVGCAGADRQGSSRQSVGKRVRYVMRERAQQAERLFECADIREQIDLHGQRTLVSVKCGDEQIDCGAR